jgi:hypothetical protein
MFHPIENRYETYFVSEKLCWEEFHGCNTKSIFVLIPLSRVLPKNPIVVSSALKNSLYIPFPQVTPHSISCIIVLERHPPPARAKPS